MAQRVVVPLDGSETAATILRFILPIAGPLDFEVTLVQVVPSGEPDAAFLEARRYLEGVAAELEGKGVRAHIDVRRGSFLGNPAEAILACARDNAADLIAMTTRGKGGLADLVLGSVARAILHSAPTPVFLFRHVDRAPAREQ